MRFSSTVVALGLVCLSGWVSAQNVPAAAAAKPAGAAAVSAAAAPAAAAVPAAVSAAAPATAPASAPVAEKSAQQNKMAVCNKQAEGKKGDERKAFMSECLKK